MAQPPETRFARAGDVDIAYQVVGPAAHLHERPVVPEKPDRLEPGCVTCGSWVEIAGA
jgi:hypothetical protein